MFLRTLFLNLRLQQRETSRIILCLDHLTLRLITLTNHRQRLTRIFYSRSFPLLRGLVLFLLRTLCLLHALIEFGGVFVDPLAAVASDFGSHLLLISNDLIIIIFYKTLFL